MVSLGPRCLLPTLPLSSCSCSYKNFHPLPQSTVSSMPGYAEESFKIEMKTNMWHDALEVCHLTLTSQQYLSANVLKDITEIILVSMSPICLEL